MIRRLIIRDSVAITGTVIGILAYFLGWLTLKSSRIAEGSSLGLYEILGWVIPTIILGLWLLCFILSFFRKGTLSSVILGTTANLILVISFVFIG